jgi:hypothetical protein
LASPFAQTVDVDYATLSGAARGRGSAVPIREIIERKYGAVFEPDDIPHLVAGYEAALRKLGLVDRRDPRVVIVAKLIIRLAQEGERDPNKLCDRVAKILRK